MPFSTGIITNTRATGTAATTVVVNTRNENLSAASTITIVLYASVDSHTFYTAYVTSFVIPPNSFDVRTFFISGNVAYEVQTNTSSPQVLFSVYGLDEFGNLVTEQGKLQADLSFIGSLTL
ncbi:hypothetical protein I8J29_01540 [Paenibacillus sp. MWE-103]|uniref:DUF4183 domain-containing protein n=1 Tax=Paenibacillus artemisiicola TaxID=1172618 RepID=A0ABS3W3I0_9BACL|nr:MULTISPECIES: hypothetical protein [Paenibacillus]MBO7742860.1 hypothetical protein [Paenibacillus artemisiicola]SFI38699.1 hypothetical protein SAMN02799624_00746 [Paenibacillus sp. UNC496MF]